MRDDRHRRGNATAVLLLLLLAGLGGWNYHRNMQAEEQRGPRTFEGYATEDLTQLRDAYDAEIAQYQDRFAAQQRQRHRPRAEGLMGERVEEFERVQRKSERLRELTADVADREARLREIEQEIDYRLAQKTGFALHLQRLTSI